MVWCGKYENENQTDSQHHCNKNTLNTVILQYLTLTLEKVLKTLVDRQLLAYLDCKSVLLPQQSDFQPQHSYNYCHYSCTE